MSEFSDVQDGKQSMSYDAQYVFYTNLPESKKTPAIEMLRNTIRKEDQDKMRQEIAKDPENWYVPYHFFFGMAVRNSLRDKGFGEDYWPIWNLDDIYVYLLKDAVKE
jgi:hypothetical protein